MCTAVKHTDTMPTDARKWHKWSLLLFLKESVDESRNDKFTK